MFARCTSPLVAKSPVSALEMEEFYFCFPSFFFFISFFFISTKTCEDSSQILAGSHSHISKLFLNDAIDTADASAFFLPPQTRLLLAMI